MKAVSLHIMMLTVAGTNLAHNNKNPEILV